MTDVYIIRDSCYIDNCSKCIIWNFDVYNSLKYLIRLDLSNVVDSRGNCWIYKSFLGLFCDYLLERDYGCIRSYHLLMLLEYRIAV